MAEEPAPAATEPTTPEPDKGSDKTFTQDQVNDLIAKEKGRIQGRFADYDELKLAKAELDEIKESNATDLDKAQGKLTKTEKERDEAKAQLVRFQVAKEKEVPASAVDFLQGSTREELEASADKLLELVKKPDAGDPPDPDFNGGARQPAPENKTPEQAHSELLMQMIGAQPPS